MTYKTGSWGEQARQRNQRRFSKSVGKQGELEVLGLLGVSRKLERGNFADLQWQNKLIDVKTSILDTRTNRWKFSLYAQKGNVDFFLCLCKGKDGRTKYIFMIPDKDLKYNNLTISLKNIKRYKNYLFGSELG